VVTAVAAIAAVFIGWIFVIAVRLLPGVIVLTPTGIYHRSLLLEHFVPWDAVVDVLAWENPDPRITVKGIPVQQRSRTPLHRPLRCRTPAQRSLLSSATPQAER
jgi:hypothetical protein